MNPAFASLLHASRAFRTLAIRVGRTLAVWAAAQTWSRLLILSVLALIAQSIISDNVLHWQDERSVTHHHRARTQTGLDVQGDQTDPDVHIGWDGINVTHHAAGAAGPTGATAATASPGQTDAAGVSGAPGAPAAAPTKPDGKDDVDEDSTDVVVHHTFTGWLRDALEGLVLLLIVYLIAAKIVVRQAARSEARAVEAEAVAATAEAQAERNALRYQLAQAQLQTLQAQVEPHFLFNTLASVDFLIETDPVRASAMQKNLIRYLRAALPQMRDHGSHLGREIELVRAYLEILQVRMEDRLRVVIDVPDGLRSAEFPPMLLQSLVENAIRHGLEPKAEGGEICICASVEDGALRVQVRDTGVGLTAAANACRSPGESGGVGLRNARERLALLYPDAAGCNLEANQPTGAIASIYLPYRVATAKPMADSPA